MTLAYNAMMFARDVHKDQVRRYTQNPYVDHLAEVAGIAMTADHSWVGTTTDVIMATAWLHDSIEDQGIKADDLCIKFGFQVSMGVLSLSDMEIGTRAERKAASRALLAQAPGWVQTIKVADLISNTSSIVKHDPKFAVTYLEEKRLMLDVLGKADPRLLRCARDQVFAASHGNFSAPA